MNCLPKGRDSNGICGKSRTQRSCHTHCSRGAVHGVGGKALNRAESQALRGKKSWGKMFLHGNIELSPDGLPSHAKNRRYERYETNELLVESPPTCDACQTAPSFLWFWGRKKLLFTQKLPGFSNVNSFYVFCYVVWLGFTASCRRTFERNLRSLARCTSLHVRFTRFHQDLGWLSCLCALQLSGTPSITSWFEFHRTFRPVFCFEVCDMYWYLCHRCLPSYISDARSCHRYLEPNDCSAPILLPASSAPSMTWLRNGLLVFDSLDRGG